MFIGFAWWNTSLCSVYDLNLFPSFSFFLFLSVEPHYDDARVFKLFYYQSGSLTNKSRNAMMHLNMKSGKDSTISLQERNYECVSVFDRNEWILVFRRVLVDYWQREFECQYFLLFLFCFYIFFLSIVSSVYYYSLIRSFYVSLASIIFFINKGRTLTHHGIALIPSPEIYQV